MEYTEEDRPFLEAKLAEIRGLAEQERRNTALLQVGLNDWTAVTMDSNESVTDEQDRTFLNERINERIQRAALKWTFLPDQMTVRGPHNRNYIVTFKHEENEKILSE